MLVTWFSTARSVTTIRSAMPVLERPSAIRSSTSRSRGLPSAAPPPAPVAGPPPPRAGRRGGLPPRLARPPPALARPPPPPPAAPQRRTRRYPTHDPSTGSRHPHSTPPTAPSHTPPPRTGSTPAPPPADTAHGSASPHATPHPYASAASGYPRSPHPAWQTPPAAPDPPHYQPAQPPQTPHPPTTAPHPPATTPNHPPALLARDHRRHAGTGAVAPHGQHPVQSLDPVGQPAQAGTAQRVSPADAVVGDLDRCLAVEAHDTDRSVFGVGVLGNVRERLRHHVVGGCLDRRGQRLVGDVGQHHRQRGSGRQRLQRRAQPPVGEDRGVDAPRQLAQLLQRLGQLLAGRLQDLVGRRWVALCQRPGQPQ